MNGTLGQAYRPLGDGHFFCFLFIVLERKFLQTVFETMQVIIDKFSDILSVKSNILAKSLRHFC